MIPPVTDTPYAELAHGRVVVRRGRATVVVTRRRETAAGGSALPGYVIECHELAAPYESDLDDPMPWEVQISEEIDLTAALRIADVVANRADEHLGRTERFREAALVKINEAINAETGPEDVEEDPEP